MQKKQLSVVLPLIMIMGGGMWLMHHKKQNLMATIMPYENEGGEAATEEDEMSQREMYVKQRAQYEFDMLKDPATGTIPREVYIKEMAEARTIPLRQYDAGAVISSMNSPSSPNGPSGVETNNTYFPAGPTNQGGRTRAVAFDKRTNQVILAGSVSGGIFRTSDGGNNWTRVTPEGEIHNVTAIAQDPRAGFENNWFAGGGEAIGNSAATETAYYYGFGILKSTDNGVTWARLTLSITDINGTTLGGGTIENFDNAFDLVHRIAVHPITGDVYICGHRRLIRSTDGGASFKVVFTGTTASTGDDGQMDIAINNSGSLYLGVNGGFADLALRGLWVSSTGDANSWTRIAGGQTANVDSVSGWRANSYTFRPNSTTVYKPKRIILAIAPSNQNILYVTYENGLLQTAAGGSHPEIDLFKFDFTTPPGTYTNLSANMPDFPGQIDGIDPFAVQEGYDLTLAVKPDDPNVVFVGGTNLYRSTDGFATNTNTEWIGGYKKGTVVAFADSTHPDIHNLVFDPSNPSRAICANDGGIQYTDNIMASNPAPAEVLNWIVYHNYQTLQYYHVSIDPATGLDFIGGAQDNGTFLRQEAGIPPNQQQKLNSGDGGAAAIYDLAASPMVFSSSQLGNIVRHTSTTSTNIKPNNSEMTANIDGGFGEFVTYFKMDFDNHDDIYYVNFNKIFRTNNASTVTTSGWTYMSGISAAVNPGSPNGTDVGIRALELTRGPYLTTHSLFIGTTNGKVLRLDNPRSSVPTVVPVDITPPGLTGFVSGISANPNDDNELLVTVSNYGVTSVFWTNNAKNATPTWKNAEGNLTLPSYRSCQIIVKKDASGNSVKEYYVGTSVGLYSATNIDQTLAASGNITWSREGANVLNFAVIQAMDYRPQDNTLVLGTHGNGMYYTSVGTPNFQPNQNTGTNDPVRNDKNFIQKAFPTLATNRIDYRIGNMFTIPKVVVRVHNTAGQLVYNKEENYTDGSVDITRLARGSYILTITSKDYKQQFVQQFVKN